MSNRNTNVFSASISPWFTFEYERASPHMAYFNLGSTVYIGKSSNFLPSNEIVDLKINIDDTKHILNIQNAWNITETYSGSIISNSNSLRIGILDNSSTKCPMLLSYLKILKDNISVAEFIPILDDEHNPCFYNTINKQRYYSASQYPFEIQ